MKILIFGHSGTPGGAQNALRFVVGCLKSSHEVHVVLPYIDGDEGAYYKSIGIPCYGLNMPMALPDLGAGLLSFLRLNLQVMLPALMKDKYDLVYSHTLSILHGNLIAHLLQLPHVTNVLEYLDDPELLPTSISKNRYLKIIEEGSTGLIACSRMAMGEFSTNPNQPRLLMEPFDYRNPALQRPLVQKKDLVLQVIGVQTYRKNIVFAVNVTNALNVIGIPVRLEIIGDKSNASNQLQRVIKKRGIKCRTIPHQKDPYALNKEAQVITLVCAKAEPYGLTIPESLRLGIPVVASKCGGPEEVLPESYLFPQEDVDQCVRILCSIWLDYGKACEQASQIYQRLSQDAFRDDMSQKLDKFLQAAKSTTPSLTSDLKSLLDLIRKTVTSPVTYKQLTSNIALVAKRQGIDLSLDEINTQIKIEQTRPGTAGLADIRHYGVVPFGMSAKMDQLYREGFGLAIELASRFSAPERLLMAAFIASHLWEESQEQGRSLSVLALGDGIGIDSLRLANAGFEVDYMDYDQSNMARVASENFDTYAKTLTADEQQIPRKIHAADRQYDVVVCLEVIEHVPDPMAFIGSMAQYLKSGGLAYISECFNGVQARWPTHLASNEHYAGLLPFMMHERFSLETMNLSPKGKPFVFRKRPTGDVGSVMDLLSDRTVMADLIKQRIDIGL